MVAVENIPGLQLYGVVLHDTIHFYHATNYLLLFPLLYGLALSDSVSKAILLIKHKICLQHETTHIHFSMLHSLSDVLHIGL